MAEEILLCLACLIPGALAGTHGELLRGEWLCPPELFRGGDAASRDRLFELLDTRSVPDSILSVHGLLDLAWIGDEAVQSRFQEWRSNPPRWRPYLHAPPEDYAREAGWELTRAGVRRDLFHRECYGLSAAKEPIIQVGADQCVWCGLPLVTLFDIDLRDPRVEFLGISGETLCIATCEHCVIFAPVFTELDSSGGCRWSNFNLKPSHTAFHRRPVLEAAEPWLRTRAERHRLSTIGDPRPSPFEAQEFVVLWLGLSVSQVGGHPLWIQDSEYPHCPRCEETMMFVAQYQDQPEPTDQVIHPSFALPVGSQRRATSRHRKFVDAHHHP